MRLKIYGLQRSATNLAEHLIRINFPEVKILDESSEQGGWKHGKLLDYFQESKGVKFLICVRNPFSHLMSFYNYLKRDWEIDYSKPSEFDPAMTLGQFLTSPCYEFENPIQRWNQMNRHWLQIPKKLIVRQEDHPNAINNIAQFLGYPAIPRITTKDRIDVRCQANGTYSPVDLSPIIKFQGLIQSQLDPVVMSRLRYE